MGFLDKKGVKKLVNWVKDKINNISIPETGQPVWSYDITIGGPIYLSAYIIYKLTTISENVDIYFDEQYLPDITREYKLKAEGRYLNYVIWPSVFDMPWPNNEIPVFEEYKQYEIYIAGGRVVSVVDITAFEEEVTYTITGIESKYSYISVETYGTYLEFYENGEFVEKDLAHTISSFDGSTLTLTIKGDLSKIRGVYVNNLQYLKIDCSKMKSDNFHRVVKGLKIDEIIYPQSCTGSISYPIYDFEANEVNLDFLYKNILSKPVFAFKTNNLILNKHIYYEYCDKDMFNNSKLTNKQINKILILGANSYVDIADSFYGADVLNKSLTLGTLYYPILIINSTGRPESNLFGLFGSFILSNGYNKYVINFDEVFICGGEINNLHLYINSHFSERAIAFIQKFNPDISIEATKCDFYSYEELPQSVKDNNPDCTFTLVESCSEVPFKYAPTDLEDVKNYDENGNVID